MFSMHNFCICRERVRGINYCENKKLIIKVIKLCVCVDVYFLYEKKIEKLIAIL